MQKCRPHVSLLKLNVIERLAKKVKDAGYNWEGGVTDCEYVRYRNLSWVPETAT